MKCRRIIIAATLLLLGIGQLLAQAKKPILMVVPSDAWCIANHYTKTFDNMGETEIMPDYKKAMQFSGDLNAAITKINLLMQERDFPLQDLQQTLKDINNTSIEESLISSKATGAGIKETPLDQFRRVAKADIIMELNWEVLANGPRQKIRYTLRGLDAYTNKQVAAAEGIGAPSMAADIPTLLEEAVLAHMDNFCDQLQRHFDDMMQNGREVAVSIRVFDDGSGIDLESEFGGQELTDIIDNWMSANTVQHRYNMDNNTETQIDFKQVRIPLYRANGTTPMDTRSFTNNLVKVLRGAPFNLPCKLVNQGLGKCTIIIGEK